MNQQFFATKLRLSTRTVHLHEHGRSPEMGALIAYWLEALAQNDHEAKVALTKAIDAIVNVNPGWRFEWNLSPAGTEGAGTFTVPGEQVKESPAKGSRKGRKK